MHLENIYDPEVHWATFVLSKDISRPKRSKTRFFLVSQACHDQFSKSADESEPNVRFALAHPPRFTEIYLVETHAR